MRKNGFVLISGVNQLPQVNEICHGLDSNDVLFIYSSWDGYYKDPVLVAINPRYKAFRDAFTNVIGIHTSGHASKETIHKVIKNNSLLQFYGNGICVPRLTCRAVRM